MSGPTQPLLSGLPAPAHSGKSSEARTKQEESPWFRDRGLPLDQHRNINGPQILLVTTGTIPAEQIEFSGCRGDE